MAVALKNSVGKNQRSHSAEQANGRKTPREVDYDDREECQNMKDLAGVAGGKVFTALEIAGKPQTSVGPQKPDQPGQHQLHQERFPDHLISQALYLLCAAKYFTVIQRPGSI